MKMAKNYLKWPKFPFFSIDPTLSNPMSTQLIGNRLFIKNKELWIDLSPKPLYMDIFQYKMTKKSP